MNMGVPQGSILGPVLFLLYINDIERAYSTAKFTLYADDTSLQLSDKSQTVLENKCCELLQSLSNWFSHNDLYFNVAKTQVVRFHHPKKHVQQLSLSLNNLPLLQTNKVKFLGVTIDEHLNWKAHCTELVSKLHSTIFLIKNLKHVLTLPQIINLYHSEISSRLRYGICYWGHSSFASKVLVAQKRL
ncbi:hypothetical protein PPYR_13821 [Photinus pyralis]|uniref:Reverse transcriptase domain-containing protein n=1 Tax=Photinus pyralis TaxID=7054 RepID=A0A5N4AA46_PHOPY|nr:hypothetical protein PPYR_13821 [Photinus pyralis]